MKDLLRQLTVILTVVVTLVVNGLANALPLNGLNTGSPDYPITRRVPGSISNNGRSVFVKCGHQPRSELAILNDIFPISWRPVASMFVELVKYVTERRFRGLIAIQLRSML